VRLGKVRRSIYELNGPKRPSYRALHGNELKTRKRTSGGVYRPTKDRSGWIKTGERGGGIRRRGVVKKTPHNEEGSTPKRGGRKLGGGDPHGNRKHEEGVRSTKGHCWQKKKIGRGGRGKSPVGDYGFAGAVTEKGSEKRGDRMEEEMDVL